MTLKINSIKVSKLIENYPNDGIFEYFLCQFIEKKMIKEIKSHIILETIFIFLKEYCSSIEVFLKHLPQIEKKDNGFSVSITVTDNLIDPDMKDYWYGGSKEFIDYLKTRFKIQWLKDTSKIQFNKPDKLIEIVETIISLN